MAGGGGGGGMSTIRKPGGHGHGGPSLDNSFTNHHNNSINGGMSVHGISGPGGNSKIMIQYANDHNGNTSNMTNKNSSYNKYMSPYQKNINKKNNVMKDF